MWLRAVVVHFTITARPTGGELGRLLISICFATEAAGWMTHFLRTSQRDAVTS